MYSWYNNKLLLNSFYKKSKTLLVDPIKPPIGGLHVYSEAGPAWCRQFADGTGSVVANDPVGYMHNAGTLKTPFTQVTTGARPLIEWDAEREAWYLQFDGVDDSLGLLLDTYTVCDLFVACAPPSSRGGIVSRTEPSVALESLSTLYVNPDSSKVRQWEGIAAGEFDHPGQVFRVLRHIATTVAPKSRLYIDTEAAPATVDTSPVSKDRMTLGIYGYTGSGGGTFPGNSRIYAIAATLGSVMSPEQVNAIKADWSAKFGVEFAW